DRRRSARPRPPPGWSTARGALGTDDRDLAVPRLLRSGSADVCPAGARVHCRDIRLAQADRTPWPTPGSGVLPLRPPRVLDALLRTFAPRCARRRRPAYVGPQELGRR